MSIRRRCGWRTGYDSAGSCNAAGQRRSSERRPPAHEGYAYVFPKRDHVNVGIGYVLSHYRERDRCSAVQSAARLRRSAARPRASWRASRCARNFTPFIIPVGGPLREPGRGRVLLAGDAGGFVNGFTAEGHLLRDGLRRPRGAGRAARPRRDAGSAGRPLPARLRRRNRQRAARLGADSAILCSPIAAELRG